MSWVGSNWEENVSHSTHMLSVHKGSSRTKYKNSGIFERYGSTATFQSIGLPYNNFHNLANNFPIDILPFFGNNEDFIGLSQLKKGTLGKNKKGNLLEEIRSRERSLNLNSINKVGKEEIEVYGYLGRIFSLSFSQEKAKYLQNEILRLSGQKYGSNSRSLKSVKIESRGSIGAEDVQKDIELPKIIEKDELFSEIFRMINSAEPKYLEFGEIDSNHYDPFSLKKLSVPNKKIDNYIFSKSGIVKLNANGDSQAIDFSTWIKNSLNYSCLKSFKPSQQEMTKQFYEYWRIHFTKMKRKSIIDILKKSLRFRIKKLDEFWRRFRGNLTEFFSEKPTLSQILISMLREDHHLKYQSISIFRERLNSRVQKIRFKMSSAELCELRSGVIQQYESEIKEDKPASLRFRRSGSEEELDFSNICIIRFFANHCCSTIIKELEFTKSMLYEGINEWQKNTCERKLFSKQQTSDPIEIELENTKQADTTNLLTQYFDSINIFWEELVSMLSLMIEDYVLIYKYELDIIYCKRISEYVLHQIQLTRPNLEEYLDFCNNKFPMW